MRTSIRTIAQRPNERESATGWYLTGSVEPGATICRNPINSHTYIVGRRPEAQLILHSMRVSGVHAELSVIGGSLFVRDLKSTNGTFVNRKRIHSVTPLTDGDLLELADLEFCVEFRAAPIQRPAVDPILKKTAAAIDAIESAWIHSKFRELMTDRAIVPHYQPIVLLEDPQIIIGYEALARSLVVGLESPKAMFDAAEQMSMAADLSRVCRQRAVEQAPRLPRPHRVFLNTHPMEKLKEEVIPSLAILREHMPDVNLVVEVHEGAIQDPRTMLRIIAELKEIDVDVAYDDFGAGQSRLLELVKAPPTYLKFDRCLIQGLHEAPVHQQRLIRTLTDIARDFNTLSLGEGIETAEESEICKELGMAYGQGYYFGRPAAAPIVPRKEKQERTPAENGADPALLS